VRLPCRGRTLDGEALASGLAGEDMVAVVHAIRQHDLRRD
jgi:hypothetical protein